MSALKYTHIYGAILKINFARFLEYRGNFIPNSLVSILWGAFSIVVIVLLMSNSTSIYGWKRSELLVLTAAYSAIVGMFHTLFTRNFEEMSNIIHKGQLDGMLLKPIDAQFMLTNLNINFPSFPRVFIAIGFILWVLQINHIVVTPIQWLYFVLLGCIGLLLLYSIFFTILTITVWQSHLSNLNELLHHLLDSAKFPQDMYRQFFAYGAFFLIPIALIISLPTKALFARLSGIDVTIFFALACGLFLFSRIFWKFALRSYTSASS